MSSCYYVSIGAQTFAATHVLPTLVTLSLTVASLRLHGREWFPAIFGFYLHFWQYVLWIFQVTFQIMRPEPFCSQYHTFAFPSQESFYAAALATFILSYAWLWKATLGWFTWMFIYTLIIFPPIVLSWFSFNRWWEILFSMGMGIVATVCFVVVIYTFITPMLPYELNHFPWTFFSYEDTFCCNGKQQRKRLWVKKCVDKFDRLYGSWSLFY